MLKLEATVIIIIIIITIITTKQKQKPQQNTINDLAPITNQLRSAQVRSDQVRYSRSLALPQEKA